MVQPCGRFNILSHYRKDIFFFFSALVVNDRTAEMRSVKRSGMMRARQAPDRRRKGRNYMGGSCFNVAINHSRRSNENLCHKRADCQKIITSRCNETSHVTKAREWDGAMTKQIIYWNCRYVSHVKCSRSVAAALQSRILDTVESNFSLLAN